MSKIKTIRSVVLLIIGLLLTGLAHQAWAVDGVVLINQANALAGNVTPGDAPGFPVTISQPGSYRLSSNLIVNSSNVNAIEITVNQVTLDLNGFTIFGTGKASGSGSGITVHVAGTGGSNVTVMNGTVRDMGKGGISLDSSCVIDHVKALNNGGDGIHLTSGAHVLNSQSGDNDGNGIYVNGGVIADSIFAVNQGNGVLFHGGAVGSALVIDNEIERNTGFGLLDETPGSNQPGYARNVFADNNKNGGGAQVSNALQIGPNNCGGALCP